MTYRSKWKIKISLLVHKEIDWTRDFPLFLPLFQMDTKLSIKNTKQQLLDAYVATKGIQEEKQILIGLVALLFT